jgi:uncharacterized protein YqeY
LAGAGASYSYIYLVPDELLERIREDTRAAMRAGEKDRTAALRVIASAVQTAAKDGETDTIAILQRERKKRLEAAEAFRGAGRDDRAAAEEGEAELVAAYLPEQISDEELEALVAEAVAQTGAESVKDMGRVMGALMPKVKGRADGSRVSAAVRKQLGA